MKPPREFAAPTLLERERAHRRTTLTGVALLLLFVTSPVFGHHIADPLSNWLLGKDHFLMLCVVALHELMDPVHRLFHILLAAGLAYAVFDRLRAVLRLRATLRLIQPGEVDGAGRIGRAAAAVGIEVRHIRRISADSVPAFTAGIVRPLVYVSDKLAADLSPEELEAVIAHEAAHRRRRDPLRLSVWRFLGCALFFLPALRALVEDMADEAEIAADDSAAADARVEPLALASALLSIAEKYRTGLPVPAAVGLLSRDLLDRRVRRLAGEPVAIASHLTRRSMGLAALVLVLAWTSGLLVAHPLPEHSLTPGAEMRAGHEPHCIHPGAWPLTHLFCRGMTALTGPCPHTGAGGKSATG